MRPQFEEISKMMSQPRLDDESLKLWLKDSRELKSVKRLQGDASTRRYYRVVFSKSGESYILMKMEDFTDLGELLPFLEVQKFLTRVGVSVPNVYDFDPGLGVVLLEDLGDTTLLHRLKEVSNFETERLIYQCAVDLLIDFQINADPSKHPNEKVGGFALRFDFEKLFWEVSFTIEHFYELYLKRQLKNADRAVLIDGFTDICNKIAEYPVVFTHRDYHSRNIMITGSDLRSRERAVLIDFQDARMGPPQYDLASLLKDSYYQLDEKQVEGLVGYYLNQYEERTGQKIDRTKFLYVFDLMCLQRSFKAIGSFASFLNRRSDATYLKYIGNTFESIRRILLKYPQYSALREVLFYYYYF